MNVRFAIPVCLIMPLSVFAAETATSLQDQKNVAVTIYNDNLALVKDQRNLHLDPGSSTLAFKDVSAQIRPETALLRSLSQPGKLAVIEQNFDFDLLTPQKLLDKFVGKTVTIVKTNPATGAESSELAHVLANNAGTVLKFSDRIETGVPGRIVYPEVPANLRERPTLVMSLTNSGAANQDVELSYLTGGLGWHADYVAELNAAENKLDLSGWVTLTNTSGTTYRNAKLQLVAGDVNRVVAAMPMLAAPMAARKAEMAADNAMREESLLEYHLYSLDRSTTIEESQTKQVSLLSASEVPARKELVLQGSSYYYQASYGDLGQKLKVGTFLEFDNKEVAHLGLPLPKGVMRVYKKDANGNVQFVGEDSIDHTPKNEKVRLKLGDSFDVTADKKQTDFKKIAGDSRNLTIESAYDIQLKNAKNEVVTVTVLEPVPGDWKIVSESQPHTKGASNTAVWKIIVPAEGKVSLVYRTRVKF
ncbi:uncharacterized protein NMK_0565 [Novimethylophilus kurashikiensis]|uniref:DUF4139 domain-containing protein n=1 Tax=Novimethylophilus kurashikiensis TaxID=1825523 RepID=A0A2R5F3E8_9PROT|nr:DUF4139 domain-containing protein [Novimethylophilus kurashikiensis]GBG13027.1 uncharacterized protein NMK_0565 [Novimethylophilus kurashikiensis]